MQQESEGKAGGRQSKVDGWWVDSKKKAFRDHKPRTRTEHPSPYPPNGFESDLGYDGSLSPSIPPLAKLPSDILRPTGCQDVKFTDLSVSGFNPRVINKQIIPYMVFLITNTPRGTDKTEPIRCYLICFETSARLRRCGDLRRTENLSMAKGLTSFNISFVQPKQWSLYKANAGSGLPHTDQHLNFKLLVFYGHF
ncbi:hypothetical protein Pcinc_031450 [Petrolisthes cinctipes]|uniref:Uncharacterized protein n=1 Tax=Petrolisthes cinctipes TaxID=88211 RepID=A0AAE1EWN5_PETCI|nr:hypothetical protein Pcinc_031450 [Petrolisthes cinctipes]